MNKNVLSFTSLITSAMLIAALTSLSAQSLNATQSPSVDAPSKAVDKRAPAKQPKASEDQGQRVFEQNCSRCHDAPEGFSPRISGTIARHMRVRANLSAADERSLLRFLNP